MVPQQCPLMNWYSGKDLYEAKDHTVLAQGEGHPHREDAQDNVLRCKEQVWCVRGGGGRPVWLEQGEPGEEKDRADGEITERFVGHCDHLL